MRRYAITATKQYKKDCKRLRKSGRDLSKLERIIDTLASGKTLPNARHDHALKGNLQGTRECHIGSDWLLRYAEDEKYLVLLLIQTGNHRQVLGME
ncbi:MAG: type II toxin-antitoxin system YafQ family toxin [Candidatus Peregrinibacteria bacterium]